ncbi:hypothetical protein SNF32_06425 [Enterococcus mundtii]|nr:hypothetical protein [Enterococcus mundtii]
MMFRLVLTRDRTNEKEEAYDWSMLTRILLTPDFSNPLVIRKNHIP